jgi:hypothetical protein
MKKITFVLLLMSFSIINAQNIQFLKGVKDLNFVTIELFKPLEHGRLYYFTDFKMNKSGFLESYTEISKYWNLTKTISLTAQFNGGLNRGFRIYPVFLFGFSKCVSLNKLDLSLDVLYRKDRGTDSTNIRIGDGVQLTGTFLRDWGHFQISGYCDLWQTKNSEKYNIKNHSVIFIFEPQAWWKFSKRIYLGIEGRLSNFNSALGLDNYAKYVMFGFKWNLE